MLAEVPSRTLSEWRAFASIEPIGERRADYRAAQIVTALANINRDRKSHPDPFKLEDFLLKFGEPERPRGVEVDELTPDQQVFFLETLNAAFGGKDLRDSPGN